MLREVDAIERRLADAEEEGAALLEADIGGSLDEVGGEAVGDGGEGSHGAGKDDHGVGGVAAAGDVGADVVSGCAGLWGRAAEELFGEVVAAAEL